MKKAKVKALTADDITKMGPMKYRQLQEANEAPYNPETATPFDNYLQDIKQSTRLQSQLDPEKQAEQDVYSPISDSKVGWGESMFDDNNATAYQFQHLGDIRANNEPWYAKVAAGTGKGVVLTGTTILNGTIGLVAGLASMPSGGFSALWDNEVNRKLQAINDWSEEVMPNYYSEAERNGSFADQIFTANFLGDALIKNFGFTVGALYSGMGWSSLLNVGGKLAAATKLVAATSKAPAIINSFLGAGIAAVNEGSVEAINNSRDFNNLAVAQADDKYGAMKQAALQEFERNKGKLASVPGDGNAMVDPAWAKYQQDMIRIEALHNAEIKKIDENTAKMGNADLLMNIPILTASNMFQFGKALSGGFKTAKVLSQIERTVGKEAGEYAAKRTMGKVAAKAILNPTSEALEEFNQSAASNIAGTYYNHDTNDFYMSQLDPNSEHKTADVINSFAEGLNETVNQSQTWQGALAGFITGAMGIPTFKMRTRADGSKRIGMEMQGGIYGEFREGKEQVERDNELVDYMNKRVQDPEFLNYYRGMIRHEKYQNDMNNAVDNNDEFSFKNAEYRQLISDIRMFSEAGRLSDITDLVKNFTDTSDENLEAIISSTTKEEKDENGKTVYSGRFVDKAGNKATDDPELKKKMIEDLTKDRNEILDTINKYNTTVNRIQASTKGHLNDEQLDELTWLYMQHDNWMDRSGTLAAQTKPVITDLYNQIKAQYDLLDSQLEEQGLREEESGNTSRTEEELGVSQYIIQEKEKMQKYLDHLLRLEKLSDNDLAYNIAHPETHVSELLEDIITNHALNKTQDEKDGLLQGLEDINKLVNAADSFRQKYDEYTKEPELITRNHEAAKEDLIKKETQKKAEALNTKLNSAKDIQEFRDLLDTEEDSKVKEAALKELEKQGNKHAKNHRKTAAYAEKMKQEIIHNSGASLDVIDAAIRLFDANYKASNNLASLQSETGAELVDDPSTVYDEHLSDEENERIYNEALFTIKNARDKLKNDSDFIKDMQPSESNENKEFDEFFDDGADSNETKPSSEKESVDERTELPTPDGTETIPETIERRGKENIPATVETEESPVGDKSDSDLLDDAMEANSREDNKPEEKQKNYYRPSIPEIHIEASKSEYREKADYRPFNIVVRERNPKVDFDVIYDFHERAGAFSYVNEGKLKPGDKVIFSVSEELESDMKAKYDWYKGPTILMITESGQIVGSLDDSPYKVIEFAGMSRLREKVLDEYSKRTNKDSKIFKSSIATSVSKIMVGKVAYNTSTRSLNDIPDVQDSGRDAIFGIVKNGQMVTNNAVSDDLITKPLNMDTKEGNLYLLIPNAEGKYTASPVKVIHFNNKEFNINSVEVQNTALYKQIQTAVEALAKVTNKSELESALNELRKYIYLGDVDFSIGTRLAMEKIDRDENGKVIKKSENRVIPNFDIYNESIEDSVHWIMSMLQHFNPPIQVSAGNINTSHYNQMLIKSNALLSYAREVSVIGSWFTTNYVNNKGIEVNAKNPKTKYEIAVESGIANSVKPVNNGNVKGIPVNYSGTNYTVDLSTSTVYNENSEKVNMTPEQSQILLDTAWADSNFGNSTESYCMTDNKIVIPSSDRVLDRSTQTYLSKEEGQNVIDKLQGKSDNVGKNEKKQGIQSPETQAVINSIEQNQALVDKSRTDSEFYYVKEDDGEYHQYMRVHTVLGDNWKGTKSDSTQKNSEKALRAGTAVDQVIRDFFNNNERPSKPDALTQEAFDALIAKLETLRTALEDRGERFLANNIVLFNKSENGTRVAGEVDILAVNKNGEFKIYDVKTSKNSFYASKDASGKVVDKFNTFNPRWQRMSTKDYYTMQLVKYKELFEVQYRTPIKQLAIMPFVLTYTKDDNVADIKMEKGIIINPKTDTAENTVYTGEGIYSTEADLPVFNEAVELLKPVDTLLPEYNMNTGKDQSVGYFELNGKVYKSFLTKLTTVDGIMLHITKVPNMTRGFGTDALHAASNNYYVVFPNGRAIEMVSNNKIDSPVENDKTKLAEIAEKFAKKPEKVKAIASEKTQLFTPNETNTKVVSAPVETESKPVSTSNINENTDIKGAEATLNAEDALLDEEDEDNDVIGVLREKINDGTEIWDSEKEMKWLEKVLPHLSNDERLKVVKGLINVAKKGTYAWGMYNKGIITLSDMAAPGTLYHESFHAVFDLLLDNAEKEHLYREARNKFGDKSEIELQEVMAEEFREYVMSKENPGLGTRILDFFKRLFAQITNWKYMQPSLGAYYQAINQGKYIKDSFNESSMEARARQESYTSEMKDILNNAKRDEEGNLLAPNGKISNLNERQYLHVRTKEFKEWFGDWENNPSKASKVVDENGEPMVVYHGRSKNITEFKSGSEETTITGIGAYVDLKTGEPIEFDSNNTIFFSDNPYVAKAYAFLHALNNIQILSDKISSLLETNYKGKGGFSKKIFKSIDGVYSTLEDLAEYNPRFIKFRDFLKQNKSEGKVLQPHEVEAFRQMLLDVRRAVQDAADDSKLVYTERENSYVIAQQLLKELNSKEGIESLKNGHVPQILKQEYEIMKKISDHRTKQGLSKVANYEEAFLFLAGGRNSILYDGEDVSFWLPDWTDRKATDMSIEELTKYISETTEANSKSLERIRTNEDYIKLSEKSQQYAVFLNLRNPFVHDYEGTMQGQGYKQNPNISFGYIAARQVSKALREGHDGVVYENLYDPYFADNYGVFRPNQIKSATENLGLYNVDNDDIRYRETETSDWSNIETATKEELVNKGWTEEMWNKISQREMDVAKLCSGL